MSTPPKKQRRVMHSLTLNELSAVDNPEQVGAKAVLMKRADPSPAVPPTPEPVPAPGQPTDPQSHMTPEAILKNAHAFDMGTEPIKFTKADYDDAMCALARLEKFDDETAEQALVRLTFTDRDPRMEALSRAAMFAPKVSKTEQPTVAKSAQEAKKDAAFEVMTKAARTGARKGESVEQAMTRLIAEGDSHMVAAAAAYYGWGN